MYFKYQNTTVSNFFYKRQLNVNLTTHSSKDNGTYNAIWNETINGRGAYEIASAIVAILKDIKGLHPQVKYFTFWSDCCVPQKKKFDYVIRIDFKDHDVEIITQIISCPGHSSIQEVDSIHSCIERSLRHLEIYSPISFIRLLKAVRRKSPFRIIQLQSRDFQDYQKSSLLINFQGVPYTKVKKVL